ncbi:MAG: TonB family protein [Opitutales bacterium]
MKLPKDQPFWTSVILHVVVLVGFFLATVIETLKPKEEPHVFEMVEAPAQEQAAAAPAEAPPPPDPEMPELEPVPEVAEVPEPVAREPEPAPPESSPPEPEPAPPEPAVISYEDFVRENPIREPRPRQSQPRQRVTAPRIEVPELVVPADSSSSASNPRQLSQQEMSELRKYSAQLRSRIDTAWSKPGNLAGVRIAATVVFDVSASGKITKPRLKPGSGNAAFDQSVLAAFRKVASAGPTPTGKGHSFTMTFRMTD